MVLVDTSVWIDHLRGHHPGLAELLENGMVVGHPFVTGELACGTLARREEFLALLQALPEAPVAEHAEVMGLVDRARLGGRGLGWIDVHLLASARLGGLRLWTRDEALSRAADELGVGRRPG